MNHPEVISALSNILGHDAVLTGDAAAPYFKDWRGRFSGRPRKRCASPPRRSGDNSGAGFNAARLPLVPRLLLAERLEQMANESLHAQRRRGLRREDDHDLRRVWRPARQYELQAP